MSDFAQAGLICTLQRLTARHGPQLEAELEELSARRPIILVLPCHGGELQQPALLHLREELRGARWLSEVIVSMNRLSEEEWREARDFFGELPQPVRLLWNDGPELGPHFDGVCQGVAHGKGLNLWSGIGVASSAHSDGVVLSQDCDVLSFQRENLARLAYAVADPELGFSFAKMYYSRATDRLYGRVTRLFLAPLLQAAVRCAGHHPLLDFLRSFRYPLAGEVALDLALACALPIHSSWGVEIGMLAEVFRQVDPREVAQVDGGSGYEHRHHPAEEGGALTRMAREIAETLFTALEQEGCMSAGGAWAGMIDAYVKEGRQAVQRSGALARINGLSFDAATENATVDLFAGELSQRSESSPETLPSWNTLGKQKPEWVQAFARTVEQRL